MLKPKKDERKLCRKCRFFDDCSSVNDCFNILDNYAEYCDCYEKTKKR